jgi:hypothetical protein
MKNFHPLFQLSALLLFPGALKAQTPSDSGSFFIRHGRDTVAIERFTRSATKLEGTLTIRNATRTSERYAVVVAPDATVPLIEVAVQEGVDSGTTRAKVVQRARVIFKEDSAAVDEIGRSGLVTRVLGTEPGAIPYLNLSFALLEQATRRARAANNAPSVPFFNLGGGQTIVAKIGPLGADSLRLDIGDIGFHLRVDQQGRVLGGRIPIQDVVVERQ